MRIKDIPYAGLLFLGFSLSAEGSPNIITLNYPPDGTVMAFHLMSISLSLPKGSADLIEIKVNGRKEKNVIPSREFECFYVSLELGINEIDIIAKKRGRVVDEVVFSVFRRSALVSKYEVPPAGFQKDYFHMKNRSECAACHVLEPREGDKKFIDMETFAIETWEERTVTPNTSTCYSCHRKMASYPFVHGPVSVWSCLSCHNPQAEPRYFIKNPDTVECYKCHTGQKEEWNTKKYFHAPFATGKCAVCHNPHASENPYGLVQPTWLLCLRCHTDKGSGRHIIEGYVRGNSHPTHGVPDPLRGGQELTCASCHNPHASDSPKFSMMNGGGGFELCKKCHIDQGRPLPPSGRF